MVDEDDGQPGVQELRCGRRAPSSAARSPAASSAPAAAAADARETAFRACCESDSRARTAIRGRPLVAAELLVDRADDRRDDRRAARSRWPPTSPWTSRRARRASCCAPSRPATASRCTRSRSTGSRGSASRRVTARARSGSVVRTGPGASTRDVDAERLHLAAQRLAERVDERLGRRVGRVVRDRRVARRRTGDQDAAGAAFDHAGQHGEHEVVHAEDVELNLGLLARRGRGWRPGRTSRCRRWRTGSRCCGWPARRRACARSPGRRGRRRAPRR